jgi:hypothetical protein
LNGSSPNNALQRRSPVPASRTSVGKGSPSWEIATLEVKPP